MRSALVAALVAWADSPWRAKVRRFLCGLSSDELQYIAGFLGECILESDGSCAGEPNRFLRSEDCSLKMILVREYLSRAGPGSGLLRSQCGHGVDSQRPAGRDISGQPGSRHQ